MNILFGTLKWIAAFAIAVAFVFAIIALGYGLDQLEPPTKTAVILGILVTGVTVVVKLVYLNKPSSP